MRLRRRHRQLMVATALGGMLVGLAQAFTPGPGSSAWAGLALLPVALLLALPWWRQRVTLDGERITVTPGFGRSRGCDRSQVAAWATRTLDPLMPASYLDLYVDLQHDRFMLSVPLSPLDAQDQARLLQWAQGARC